MSFAPSPQVTHQSSRARRSFSRRFPRRDSQPVAFSQGKSSIKTFPNAQKRLPGSLQFLQLLQHTASIITFSLIAAALGVYGWTVYAPKQWSQEYRKLETLQRYERHLIATNETLKNQLAQQAENPQSGLTAPHPSQNIYLTPASDDQHQQPVSPSASQTQPPIIAPATSY